MTFDQLTITSDNNLKSGLTTLAISKIPEIQPDVLVFTGTSNEASYLAASEYAARHATEYLRERLPDSDDTKTLAELYNAGKYDEAISLAEDNHDLYYGFGPQRISIVTPNTKTAS